MKFPRYTHTTMAESTPTDPLSQHAPRDPELVASLTQRNATFSRLLSLIPQQYYVAPTQEEMDNRWMKNKKRKTGDEIKEHKESKRRLREEKVGMRGVVADCSSIRLTSPPRLLRTHSPLPCLHLRRCLPLPVSVTSALGWLRSSIGLRRIAGTTRTRILSRGMLWRLLGE